MKKILILATIPLSLKAFSLDFMKYLRDKGYEVHAAAGEGSDSEIIKKEGFTYHEILISRNINPVLDFKAFKLLKNLMKEESFDLVHTQTSKAGFIGRFAAHSAGVPAIVHTAHNWSFHALLPSWQRKFYFFLEKKAAKWCDAIIVDTKAVREYGLKFGVVSPEKLYQVYMGINTDRFLPFDQERKNKTRQSMGIGLGKTVVGSIARLVPDKGVEMLIECAREMKDAKDVIFVLVGDGGLRASFENKVAEYGLSDKFIFTGHIDDVVPVLNTFDVFCLPTLREGFGVVFAEAQACGVPIVATRIPPLKEVVQDGVTGYLISPYSAESFADGIQKLFDEKRREEMSQEARRFVQDNFDIKNINEKTFAIYERLWKDKGYEKKD